MNSTSNHSNEFSRLKSVRAKPKSFDGWKENVKILCENDDIKKLQEGHRLWKIRKKPIVGTVWYHRKFQLNLE